jgi:hypothetical protein
VFVEEKIVRISRNNVRITKKKSFFGTYFILLISLNSLNAHSQTTSMSPMYNKLLNIMLVGELCGIPSAPIIAALPQSPVGCAITELAARIPANSAFFITITSY